jgi:histidyl-tRNA synthetase
MATQPARGMRDFLPEDVRRREYVVGVIQGVYDRYGFEPLETPAVENIDTLLGKYGEEGNKLIFKILKRGEHEASGQADLALRYDLTVPFARVVAEHQARLPKVFKRYQIQPVWRADRPARGRFREFYQCDIDSIGSVSPTVEAEQIAAVSEVLKTLGFQDFFIRVNHRGVLSSMLRLAGIPEKQHADVLIALDKRDKIGDEGVKIELAQRGLDPDTIDRLFMFTSPAAGTPTPIEELDALEAKLGVDAEAATAFGNLRKVFELSASAGAERLRFDRSLARGLSYYTGAIMEINVADLAGSLGGGGRYDNLIGMFLGSDIPACGFSLGLERILVVMQERGMFPPEVENASVDLLVVSLADAAQEAALSAAASGRRQGLRVDLYPDAARKLDKVFRYAEQRRAKFLGIVGEDEMANGTVSVRDLATRKQESVSRDAVGTYIAARLKGEKTAIPSD